MIINDVTFKYPAFIVGNGINLYLQSSLSWIELLNNIAKKYDIELKIDKNDRSVTYPEILEIIMFKLAEKKEYKNSKTSILYQMLKTDIAHYLDKKIPHEILVNYASENQIPILTTNYDSNLVTNKVVYKKGNNKDKEIAKLPHPFHLKSKPNSKGFYQWFDFFSDKQPDENFDAKNTFSIWHIHGTYSYPNGIKISSTDYSGLISKIKENFLAGEKNCESKKIDEYNKWYGRNSFIDIFFNNDLIIFGLALDAQESDIRWLLVERAKHFKNTNKKRETIYYYTNANDLYVEGDKNRPNGKHQFFESLGISMIKTSYSELYDKYSLIIK